jgi:hypothetical protein
VRTLERLGERRARSAPAQREHEVRCDSCGATVVFQGTLTATSCAYCGSLPGKLLRALEPWPLGRCRPYASVGSAPAQSEQRGLVPMSSTKITMSLSTEPPSRGANS